MLRRLFLVLQSILLIPPIIFLFFWLGSSPYDSFWRNPSVNFWMFVLTFTPYVLVILGKYIIYGKLYIFKIGYGDEKGMSQGEYDSKVDEEKEH